MPNNLQTFQRMVHRAVSKRMVELADAQANEIVADLTRPHGGTHHQRRPDAAVIAPAPQPPKPKRVRPGRSQRHQYAPKDSVLALAPRNRQPKATVSGQLAVALTVSEAVLATGPGTRRDLTQLLVDANPGWTRVTASSCISRLVAAGRLVVV